MEKRKRKKKSCPKCHDQIYLVGNSVDESYKILTCKNKECEHYMRILKDKNPANDAPTEAPVAEAPSEESSTSAEQTTTSDETDIS